MPTVKIAPAQPLKPSTGLPWHAADHTLTLCDRHLTQESWDMIDKIDDPAYANKWDNCGGIVYAEKRTIAYRTGYYTERRITFMYPDSFEISKLPTDIQSCIAFAASRGFNSIVFDPFDAEGCPVIEYLRVYR